MQNEPYVTLSAQVALERRLTSLANNVANMNTVGYRGAGISFHTLIAQSGEDQVAYASPGEDFISQTQGQLIRTGNPFDVAVQGEGWIAIDTPAGTAYTRDGRMQMQPDGALQTINGYAVLDAGGSPMQLDPNNGPPTITKDGMLHQNGRQLGAIGLFAISRNAKFTRYDNSAVIPDQAATPVLSFDANGVIQGYLEGANVNPVLEMAKLMTISRAMESIANASQSAENSLRDAVKSIGDMTS